MKAKYGEVKICYCLDDSKNKLLSEKIAQLMKEFDLTLWTTIVQCDFLGEIIPIKIYTHLFKYDDVNPVSKGE